MARSNTTTTGKAELIDAADNYEQTLKAVGYVPGSEASDAIYPELGFKCGLEIHQQLLTGQKLFCRCPAGIYQQHDDFDSEVVRHMRPTLSEMGEYDGTALMEKKTRKNITYRLKNETACTYEVDDTPPFLINQRALDIAVEIALMLQTNVVGELHITRKQYLDGSIPTGFQRTAIVGIEGEIPIRKRTIGIIQLSIEEDSCREVSDIGHERIYKTDRLGMPLIETVTYPHMLTPDEAAEAAQYLRLLTRTSGKVRRGIGAARQDVNVSIEGGTRVEIKGVAHIKWIPNLTHVEAFRQKALLSISERLKAKGMTSSDWQLSHKRLDWSDVESISQRFPFMGHQNVSLVAVNMPGFAGIISHFTQPRMTFGNELSDRLKVIACIEKPNLISSESLWYPLAPDEVQFLRDRLDSAGEDAQLIFWADEDDIQTALETIEERCILAFDGVPNETRKAIGHGLTIFERVLPGPDRMYPDTDSVPIQIEDERIEKQREHIQPLPDKQAAQLKDWDVPEDCFPYLIAHGLLKSLDSAASKTGWTHRFLSTLLAQDFNGLVRRHGGSVVSPHGILAVCVSVAEAGLDKEVVRELLPALCEHPAQELQTLIASLSLPNRRPDIGQEIARLDKQFKLNRRSALPGARTRWLMGKLRPKVLGLMSLSDLSREIEKHG